MECPRCESPLEQYTLGGREAVYCRSCGYIGVPVEHGGQYRELESWADAVDRIEDAEYATVETTSEDPTIEVVLEASDPADADPPSPTEVRMAAPDVPSADRDDKTRELSGTNGETPEPSTDEPGEAAVCEVCGERFDTESQLHGHLAVHADEELVCEVCGERFESAQQLYGHTAVHSDEGS
jgi:DNA-directed RNA polymerase subunit M/transcription elongation factor TFIIS